MISRLLAVLILFSPLTARADLLTFQPPRVGRGYAGPVVVTFTWADGTSRDMSGATGTLTVYSVAPVNGVGGTILFQATLGPAGGATMNTLVTALNNATPGNYYTEISVTQTGVTDVWHGSWVIEGK